MSLVAPTLTFAFTAAGLFLLDAALVAALVWLLVRACARELRGDLEHGLAGLLAALSVVAASGVLLGETGGLHARGFLFVHVAALAALGFARRRDLSSDLAALRAFAAETVARLRGPLVEVVPLALLAFTLAGFVVLACAAQPVVFDALTYRLSRIGHWLQEGRIGIIATDDARLNYMPVVPDLVMTWLLGATGGGFQPAALAQTLGGALLLGATLLLARLTGLSRAAALGAAWLVLGLANVVPQFTSAYTDLFTAGVVSAGFALWLRALQRGEGSCLGGVAAGLALGSKGTVAYLAPALALVVAWLAWRHRAPPRAWARTLIGAALAALLFAGPWAVRNLRTFGHPLGPPDFIVWHHGVTPGLAGSARKLELNLASAFAQLCEPNSQPPWWRAPTRALGEAVARRLPASDPFAFDGIDRRANVEKLFAVGAPDADVTSTGLLLPVLCLCAVGAACRRWRAAEAQLILAWSALAAGFLLFMHWRTQWHPYLFRFVLLVVSWLVVIAAWWLARLPRRLRLVAGVVVGAATAHGFFAGNVATYQAGWPAATQPGQSLGFHVYQRWRAWAHTLDAEAGPLRPHLGVNKPLAAFFRRAVAQDTQPGRLSALTAPVAQDHVKPGDGWLIVPAAQFIGREGDVAGATFLFDGDEANPFSLAAYRALRPGERPAPLLYRNRTALVAGGARRELLVRTWNDAPLRLELLNRGSTARAFTARSPLGNVAGNLAPGEHRTLELRVPSNFPTLLTIDSTPPPVGAPDPLEARLLP